MAREAQPELTPKNLTPDFGNLVFSDARRSVRSVVYSSFDMQRPIGVTVIAAVFVFVAAYLFVIGLLMLSRPGLISMAAGAPLLGGLEVAGPYAFLLAGVFGAGVAFGLLRLNKWARRLAIIITMIGVVLLIPGVSSSVVDFQVGKLAGEGLQIILRATVVWYLYQEPIAEVFHNKSGTD